MTALVVSPIGSVAIVEVEDDRVTEAEGHPWLLGLTLDGVRRLGYLVTTARPETRVGQRRVEHARRLARIAAEVRKQFPRRGLTPRIP